MSTPRLHRRLPLISLPLLLLMATAVCLALEVPSLSGRVVDDAEILSPEARERITELCRQHEQRTSNQLAVLIVTTLQSESIENYAVQVFENWKLGQQGKDNGVLLVIAPQERRMRVEVGYGLESTLPDVIASRIIRNVITPQFKNGNYDAGVVEGVRALITVLEGDAPPAAQSASHGVTVDDMRWERVLGGCLMFGLLGALTLPAIFAPGGVGWFFYVFMLPFWAAFPSFLLGIRPGLTLAGIYLVAIPVVRMLLSRRGWYQKTYDSTAKGAARIGSFGARPSWSSRASSSGRSRGFSGGGGRSGGGGASGRW